MKNGIDKRMATEALAVLALRHLETERQKADKLAASATWSPEAEEVMAASVAMGEAVYQVAIAYKNEVSREYSDQYTPSELARRVREVVRGDHNNGEIIDGEVIPPLPATA
jgi:hypothetical protein